MMSHSARNLFQKLSFKEWPITLKYKSYQMSLDTQEKSHSKTNYPPLKDSMIESSSRGEDPDNKYSQFLSIKYPDVGAVHQPHPSNQSCYLLVGGCKFQGNTVNAVPLISWRGKPFTLESVPQMTSTCSTRDLNPPPIRISRFCDSARQSLVESRPTAPGVEFRGRLVKGSVASSAFIHAILAELVVFSRTSPFSALLPQNSELLRGEHRSPLLFTLLHLGDAGCCLTGRHGYLLSLTL